MLNKKKQSGKHKLKSLKPDVILPEVQRQLPVNHDLPQERIVAMQEGQVYTQSQRAEREQNNPTNHHPYYQAIEGINKAIGELNSKITNDVVNTPWFDQSPRRYEIDVEYREALVNLIAKVNSYCTAFDAVLGDFKTNYEYAANFLGELIMHPILVEQHKEFVAHCIKCRTSIDNAFKGQPQQCEEEVNAIMKGMFIGLKSIEKKVEQALAFPILLFKLQKFFEGAKIKGGRAKDIGAILHNLENITIESKLLMLIRSDLVLIKNYLAMSADLISTSINLLEHLNKTPDPVVTIWPSLKENLLRSQERLISMPASVLLMQKRGELLIFKDAEEKFARELMPIIHITCEGEKIYDDIKNNKRANVDEDLVVMLALLTSADCQQSVLMRFFVLAVTISCYTAKNPLKRMLDTKKIAEPQQDVMEQIRHLRDFVDNLVAVKPMWNIRIFKFLNNFVFFQHYLQDVIGAAEVAFFNCEAIFKMAKGKDTELKSQMITTQIELLQMQNTMLHFLKEVCGEDFAKNFYFKNASGSLINYSVNKKNHERASAGDVHSIIDGIPIREIIKRNESRALELEAILLEFSSQQRKLDGPEYEQAISGEELEKYLKQWEQEASEEKKAKDEEKDHKLESAHSKRRQRAIRLGKKAEKAPVKSEEERRVVMLQPASKQPKDPLVEKMDELLLQLRPDNFAVEIVSKVIDELHPLILATTNQELVFKALAAIGDSYGMIAGHHLNHGKKKPKQLIVDLKLALNFYRRSELALNKLTGTISQEEYDNYDTWLQNSIRIQDQLLEKYTKKFKNEQEQLAKSKKQFFERHPEAHKQWLENHKRTGWKLSPYSLRRHELREALKELHVLKKKCRGLIKEKPKGHQAYAFEHQLHAAGKKPLPEKERQHHLIPAAEENPSFLEAGEAMAMAKAQVEGDLSPQTAMPPAQEPYSPMFLPLAQEPFVPSLPSALFYTIGMMFVEQRAHPMLIPPFAPQMMQPYTSAMMAPPQLPRQMFPFVPTHGMMFVERRAHPMLIPPFAPQMMQLPYTSVMMAPPQLPRQMFPFVPTHGLIYSVPKSAEVEGGYRER